MKYSCNFPWYYMFIAKSPTAIKAQENIYCYFNRTNNHQTPSKSVVVKCNGSKNDRIYTVLTHYGV